MKQNSMNSPLESKEQLAIFLFLILYAVACLALVGILPSIILLFGVFLMKKNNDFSSIKISTKIVHSLLVFAMLGALAWAMFYAYEVYQYYNSYNSNRSYIEILYVSDSIFGFVFAAIALFYLLITKFMFYNILERHQHWVEVNGIFSNKPKSIKAQTSSFDVIKGEKLKQFSVADELLKWAKLKEDGHISEEEFNEMRNKLLQKQD